MSDQSETTTNTTPSTPKPCKMGCGFFGSNAMGDCCSKCYRENLQKEGKAVEEMSPAPVASPIVAPRDEVESLEPTPMEVEPTTPSQALEDVPAAPAPEKSKPKKKKKKASYKSMMAGMLQGSQEERDIEQEKEKLREVTGGGAFSKIDRI